VEGERRSNSEHLINNK